MRKLTIHREKALAALLMPVQVYITDTVDWELTIDGERCRRLGSLRSGQTKTFQISGQKAALYVGYGKNDVYFARCELPCSDEDITVSGKTKLDPKKGNPFVFRESRIPAPADPGSDREKGESEQEAADVEMEEKLKKFLEEFAKISPQKPQTSITPYRGNATVFSSKFGGVPYFPKTMEYPTVREGSLAGNPLRFLAQLNFSEIPYMEGFPTKGILQFFAGCDGDDLYGADFDDGTNQNGFRVIYHETILSDESQLLSEMPDFEDDEYPFEGEFALTFGEVEQKQISFDDHGFEAYAAAAYNLAFSTPAEEKHVKSVFGYTAKPCINDDDPDFCDALYDSEDSESGGCKIGGYPYFTQSDPRGDGAYQDYDTLLFQMDSVISDTDEIMWGDCGVANFFIAKEALARLDFSKVLYNWDCC